MSASMPVPQVETRREVSKQGHVRDFLFRSKNCYALHAPRKSVANLGQTESPYEKKNVYKSYQTCFQNGIILQVVLSKNVRLIEKSHFGSFCWPVCDRFPGGV